MKLKLKAPGPASGDAPPASTPAASSAQPGSAAPTPTTSAPKLNLKFKSTSQPSGEAASAPTADVPKQKRKYTKKPKGEENGQSKPGAMPAAKPKKRPLEGGDEGAPAKRKPKPTQKSLESLPDSDGDEDVITVAPPAKLQTHKKGPARTQSVKLSLKPKLPGQPQRTGTAVLKMKTIGKPPERPAGAGYDSEAEEAEDDPALEAQFVLRMEPGPDNDLLRKAIEEKTIGKKQSEGGPGVMFRFLDRDGRKSILTIQNRMYAATMVELPCVIESLKSWNKKDWVKTADVCQMLLVLGRVNSEEEAKKFPRPKTVEPDTHRYAHGLTPPMNWVRRRRFRPRKSYLDVERIESQTEALLAEDEQAVSTKYELIDSDAEGSSGDESYDDQDAMGEDDDMFDGADYTETPAADQMDADDLEQALAQGLMEDMEDGYELQAADGGDIDMNALFGGGNDNGEATLEVETPIATSHDVAMHALGHNGELVVEPESAVSTPAGATSPEDDDDDDDDDDEIDPEVAAKQEQDELIRGEIRELKEAITNAQNQLKETRNPLFRRRLLDRIEKQELDLKVKLSLIGEQAEDDD